MLHVLVNTHNPESCAFRGEEHADIIAGGAARLAEVCEAQTPRSRGSG